MVLFAFQTGICFFKKLFNVMKNQKSDMFSENKKQQMDNHK